MVLTVSFVLSWVNRAFLPPSLLDSGVSSPSGPTSPVQKLDSSVGEPGPHDFAVRESLRIVSRRPHVHRIPPRVSDDAYAPPVERDGICVSQILIFVNEIIFVART
jgi:hypothetical protein